MEEGPERGTLSLYCAALSETEMPKLPAAPSKRRSTKVRGGDLTEPDVQDDPGAFVPTPPMLVVDSVKFRLIDVDDAREMQYDKPSRIRKTFTQDEVDAINNFVAQLTIEGGAKRKKALPKAK